MKFIAQIKKWSVITMIIGLIGGILFIAFPALSMKYMSIAVGTAFIVIGATGIINYILDKSTSFSLVSGIIIALIGIAICFKYKEIFSLILIIIGVFVLITGFINFFTAIKIISSSIFFGWFTLALSVATIAFGIIACTKSNELSETLVQIIGAGLIIYSVLDLVAFLQVRQLVKETAEAVKEAGEAFDTAVAIDEASDGDVIEASGEIIEENDE